MLTPGGFLLTMKFNKPAVSIRQQLAIMESRGLAIKDRAIAERNLRFIGYFRLSGYALPFQAQANAYGTHSFVDNTQFENVIDLYFFDRCLRLLVIDALEKIEHKNTIRNKNNKELKIQEQTAQELKPQHTKREKVKARVSLHKSSRRKSSNQRIH